MRRTNSKFVTKYISEEGSLPVNRDYFGFAEMDNFACWAIAEGYDNDTDLLSAQLAVDTVISEFTKKPSMSKRRMQAYIKEANRQLRLQNGRFRRKASILIAVSNYNKLRYVGCGNCRINIFRGDNILAKSKDTSLYQELIDQGEIAEDGKSGIEESRNLFSHLGKRGRLRLKTSKKIKLNNDDLFLMTTWGFWEKVTRIEMLDALDGAKGMNEYLSELQDLYLSKQTRLVNNYTIAAIGVSKVFQEKDNKRKFIRIAIIVAIILIIATGIFLFVRHKSNAKRTETITAVTEFEENGDTYLDDENYERALGEYTLGVTESKKLKGTTGKKGKENKAIKNRMNIKQRVAQLVLDGDEKYGDEKYKEAGQNYTKALKEAKNDLDFYESMDSDAIQEKINICKDFLYIDDLFSLSDAQAGLKDYENALKSLEEAMTTAQTSNNKTAQKSVALKQAELQNLIKEEETTAETAEKEKTDAEQAEKQSGGQILELEGDGALTLGDNYGAIEKYNEAIAIYKEANAIDLAAATQKKIQDANAAIKEQENALKVSTAESLVMTGDNLALDYKFEDAINSYKQARDIYAQLKMTEQVTEVADKINIAQSSKQENEIAAKKLEINVLEARGDEAVKKREYSKATEFYLQAKILYQDGNQMDSVLNVQKKIESVSELENSAKVVAEETE